MYRAHDPLLAAGVSEQVVMVYRCLMETSRVLTLASRTMVLDW